MMMFGVAFGPYGNERKRGKLHSQLSAGKTHATKTRPRLKKKTKSKYPLVKLAGWLSAGKHCHVECVGYFHTLTPACICIMDTRVCVCAFESSSHTRTDLSLPVQSISVRVCVFLCGAIILRHGDRELSGGPIGPSIGAVRPLNK